MVLQEADSGCIPFALMEQASLMAVLLFITKRIFIACGTHF
ncbi:hypothetical protein BN136_2499 [Cronobacter universalis NCTC 9529]|nr:hypothetical protein BN136_2499 [Cronobacter universalis NCTC 9529]